MLPEIEKIKGVHPGQVLERELARRNIKKAAFAKEIGEYPAIISDLTKMRRGLSAFIAIKIETALDAPEGYFMILQALFEMKQAKEKLSRNFPKPDIETFRKALFWDVNMHNIDFYKRKRFVIERVFERGNDQEIKAILNFYGPDDCKYIIQSANSLMESGIYNAERFLKLKRKDLKCNKESTKKQHRKPYS